LLASLLVAAAARAADVAGHYTLRNVREMGSELLLRPDGSFEFMVVYGAADYWSKGTWKSENGAVILDTEGDDAKEPFRLLASSADESQPLRVTVAGPGGRPVPNIDVEVQGEGGPAKARTDSDGVAYFAQIKRPVEAIFRIRVYQFESEPLALNPAHNTFHFEIDGREITKVRFRNEKLTVDGTALILRFADPEHPMRYVRN
jgi:hypothetical protein